MALEYLNIFPSKALQNLPEFGFLDWKQTIWQLLPEPNSDDRTMRYSLIHEVWKSNPVFLFWVRVRTKMVFEFKI
jgi:hypothetical protein